MTPLARSHDHALPEEPQDAAQEQHGMRTIALRAGLAALALSVAVSGAAYAAVRAGEPSRTSGVEAAAKGADGLGAEGGRSRVSVTPSTQKVTTETVEAADPHGSVQQESSDLSEGETKVATAGVDGVVRTTYEVTTVGGKEVSRTPVAQVVVTKKVDEVVLVGTGEQQDQQAQQAQRRDLGAGQGAGAGDALAGGEVGVPDHPGIDGAAGEGGGAVRGREEGGLDVAVAHARRGQRLGRGFVSYRAVVHDRDRAEDLALEVDVGLALLDELAEERDDVARVGARRIGRRGVRAAPGT